MTNLSAIVRQRAQQENGLPFVAFMQLALYHPEFGYYSAGMQKFGRHGDFITAPELTPLFGQTLANQCQQILQSLSKPVIFEFGAGSGRLCVDIMTHLERLDCLPASYHILDVSSNLRHRQMALVQEEIPHLAQRINWVNQWPEKAFNGVIIANEVLDAMPVHRFLQTKDQLSESYITLDTNGELAEVFKACTNPELRAYVQQALPADLFPYTSEANLFINSWIAECYNMLHEGAMILIDYGFPRHEFYHPDRRQGTLMCHHRHLAHSNPLLHPGEQDITAHVDFTHVAEASDAAGFHVAGFTNQAAFLLANGLLSLLDAIPDSLQRIKAGQAVKQLIQPNEMGELFKVIALTKNLDLDLAGFQLHDKRVSL
jgi:SAM-dependent MidA family methyltransferase